MVTASMLVDAIRDTFEEMGNAIGIVLTAIMYVAYASSMDQCILGDSGTGRA